MRASTVLTGIAVLILWFASLTYISAPASVQAMLPGGFGRFNLQHELLGVIFFIVSLLVIALWASTSPELGDEPQTTSVVPTRGLVGLYRLHVFRSMTFTDVSICLPVYPRITPTDLRSEGPFVLCLKKGS